jgi:hypothetical protein
MRPERIASMRMTGWPIIVTAKSHNPVSSATGFELREQSPGLDKDFLSLW